MRKPYHWKARKGWYLKINQPGGRVQTVRLGENEAEAYDAWRRMRIASTEDSPRVIEIVSDYIEALAEMVSLDQLAEKGARQRIDDIRSFCESIGDELQIAELKPFHVTNWLKTKKRWNATTRHHAAEAVKRSLSWAVDQGLIETNPLKGLKVQKGLPRDHVVSREEYETLLAGVWEQNYARRQVTSFRAVLIALRLSGCRPGEIASVNVDDSDGSIWTIRDHKTKRKKQRPRNVYLSPCLQTLTAILLRGRVSGPMFRPAKDRRWQYSDMRSRFHRLRDKTKVTKKCVLYSFRHTWITNALLAGVDVATVAEMAGTSIQMIDRHYGHLAQQRSHLVDSAARVAKFQVSGNGKPVKTR